MRSFHFDGDVRRVEFDGETGILRLAIGDGQEMAFPLIAPKAPRQPRQDRPPTPLEKARKPDGKSAALSVQPPSDIRP